MGDRRLAHRHHDDDCIVSDEEIELVQSTMSAHHFNFVAPNLAAGDHTISVEAVILTDSSSGDGSSSAVGLVAKGSLTVELVQTDGAIEASERRNGADLFVPTNWRSII